MTNKNNTPENQLDEFKDLSIKEIECLKAWRKFEESEEVKSSNFNLDHWRNVKKARLCQN